VRKLWEVKDKRKETYKFVYDDEWYSVKKHIKRSLDYMEFDLRTLREIPFPSGRFECSNLDSWYGIFYNGELIVGWDDSAASEYPEDLTWNRDIASLIADVEKLKELEFEDRLKNNNKEKQCFIESL
jgi:hypothetical protein